jgi:hypothetical protein
VAETALVLFDYLWSCINKCMNLAEIRQRTAYQPNAPLTQKAATRLWLAEMSKDYPLALTLTLKQTITDSCLTGARKRAIKVVDCEYIAHRFQQKLNRAVFGQRAADKYGKSLKYIPVCEGERSSKRLHLHYAIGGLPSYVSLWDFEQMVINAKIYVEHVDAEHKVDIADSGWMEYITKEVGRRDTDNVFWRLAS